MWVNSQDPRVYSFITTGTATDDPVSVFDDYAVETALATAEAVLNGLTGGRIHPPGTATEDFRATPFIHRLSVGKRPLTGVLAAEVLDVSTPVDTTSFVVRGNNVYFGANQPQLTSRTTACQGLASLTVRLTYTFGSTISASARQALLDFARQLYLAVTPDAEGECELPSRVTSVSREGLSYTIIDPQTYLEKGQIGLPRVDLWINSVNPMRGTSGRVNRYAGVYTPDSPIGTGRVITLDQPV